MAFSEIWKGDFLTRKDLHLTGEYLNTACGNVGFSVLGSLPRPLSLTLRTYSSLSLRTYTALRSPGIKDHLNGAVNVAEMNKEQIAMISDGIHESHEQHFFPTEEEDITAIRSSLSKTFLIILFSFNHTITPPATGPFLHSNAFARRRINMRRDRAHLECRRNGNTMNSWPILD
jgi:hypothetical protein